MSVDELWFTALGPSGAGKTTLLACMHKRFEDLLPGSFYPADPKTFSTLSKAYKKLEEEANSPSVEFGVALEGTGDLRQYAFAIKGRRKSVPVRFFDFPGGWMNPHDESQKENYEHVIDIVQKSMVIIAAINTPYIMEFNGRYKDYAGIDEIEHVIKMSINNERDKLILFVPIKCERYTRSPKDRDNMLAKIKEVFSGTLKMSENPIYRDSLAIAILPIHTVGNAQFSRFEMENGTIVREVYLKNRSIKFTPKDADQPLRYAMSFLLEEFKKSSSGFWGSFLDFVFSRDNMSEISNFIRDDIKAYKDGFEIFCGHRLIGI